MSDSNTLITGPRWYAAYTRPRHEKHVGRQLDSRAVEYFLPQYESLRRWKDRRVRLVLPLFPSYVFVRVPLRERLRVLEVPGVVRLVQFKGEPAPLPDDVMERLRQSLQDSLKAEPHPFLRAGCRVRVTSGPLTGIEGVLLRRKGLLRLVVSLELIHRSICIELDSDIVEPVYSATPHLQRGHPESLKLPAVLRAGTGASRLDSAKPAPLASAGLS